MPAQSSRATANTSSFLPNSATAPNPTEHALNVRVLWFRGEVEREEPAMLALDLLARRRPEDALDVVMQALARSPRDAELLLVAGRVHLERGETERARDRFIASARLSKGWAEPFAWLARLLAGEGRREKAAEVAERAVLLGCTDPDVRELDQPRRALRVLDARKRGYLADPDRDDPAALVLALEGAGRTEDALAVLDRALELEPEDDDLDALRARLRGLDPNATSVDLRAAEDALDDAQREEAFFRSLGVPSRPRIDPDEPSVIVSDTLLGGPAASADEPADEGPAIPLVQLAPARARSGWLPQLQRPETSAMPPATVRVAPLANVARRDPTVRFWLGR